MNQQEANLKAQNKLITLITKIVMDVNKKNTDKPRFFYCTVKQVISDAYADLEWIQGDRSVILSRIANKSGVILNIGDKVVVIASHGDLSDLYISTSQSPTTFMDASHIIGTLTIGGANNTSGLIQIMDEDPNNPAMEIFGHSIDFFDFLQTKQQIGSIITDRDVDLLGNKTGSPSLSMIAEQGCSVVLGLKNTDGTTSLDGLVINNNAYNSTRNMNVNLPTNFYPGDVNNAGLEITPTGTNIFGETHHENYNVLGVNTLTCGNLNVTGTKNCVQTTKSFGDRLFNAMEYGDVRLGDHGFGNIINGRCVIAISPIMLQSVNTSIDYEVRYDFDEDCHFKLIRTPLYFVLIADKDIGFSWSIMAQRRGFENVKLEYSNGLKNHLIQPNKRNVLLDYLGTKSLNVLNKSK